MTIKFFCGQKLIRRTRAGLEIGLVLENRAGRVIVDIEIDSRPYGRETFPKDYNPGWWSYDA